ncbi:hypothetical protein BDP27DRAFT_1310900 [Rhodocollybia butyracea]|uniref:LIM zinc-binding domain-containing protein n=1 Tax=Rhodocollybia butyracea TaxID=206335 RepID=A0A9P5QBC6_9AGAR|nr:hypothetical protein BDP27DRAFT_1310900 [Rhodocollybia butyracea]
MNSQHQYWQNQPHQNSRYPPAQYSQYPAQISRNASPGFKSQAELGFELPPVRPTVQQQQQQKPIPIHSQPAQPQLRGKPRPMSMGYPPVNTGYAPHMNGIPPQLARSSSASPTRKPLPAPAPAQGARPLAATQSSGFAPLPPNRTQSVDLSAFSRFNQERMASGAINIGARNSGLGNASYAPQYSQYQQQRQSPVAPPSFTTPPSQHVPSPQSSFPGNATTPARRRASPPRFFEGGSPSRNSSPEKPGFNAAFSRSSQPVPQRMPPQARSPPPPTTSAPPSITTPSFAAVRQRNPIFEPYSPTRSGSGPTETKFVPLWKRSTISSVNDAGGSPERGRSTIVPSVTPGRPLPQPTPDRFSTRYTVEEPDDDPGNSSIDSEISVSAVSTVSTAASASSTNTQKSDASNGPGILDLRGSMPQPPVMNRAVATTGALRTGNGTRSQLGQREVPQPPEMDRAGATTGAIHAGGAGSMTLRFAKMGIDASSGSGGSWPQDLPPLPRAPGSGFTTTKPFSRPTSSHSQSSSTSSTSFSARSASPASSIASSTAGALERFRRNAQPPAQPQPQYASHSSYKGRDARGYTGHETAFAGVKIESPAPLGGKEKMANVKKMEDDSEDDSVSNGNPRSAPRINFGNDDEYGSRSSKPEVPVITFGNAGEKDGKTSRASGTSSRPPRITFGEQDEDDEDGSPSGPMIRVSGDNSNFRPPPQIMFEVPGVGVESQFGNGIGPVINVTGEDDDNDRTPRRRGAASVSTPAHQGGPRALPSTRPQNGSSVREMPGRGRGGLTCPACARPIVGRIVAAMGMKWHPDCFRCTVCDELLEFQSSYEGVGEDGIKRPYCHLDYHEGFAPKCYHCKTAIVDERFISLNDPALGRRTYHEPHFFCAECGDPFLSPSSAARHNHERDFGKGAGGGGGELAFSGDGQFSYDDDDDNVGFAVYKGHPYCEACHVRLRLPKCKRCKRPLRDHMEAVEALGGKWCWACFRCTNCDKPFEDPAFFERDKKPYCENCFSILIRNEI